MEEIKIMTMGDTIENKDKIIETFKKYYKRIGNDIIDAEGLFLSILSRLANGSVLFLTWDNFGGFITCDWQINPIRNRMEGVIWTVYNPNQKYKEKFLSLIDMEAKKKGIDAIVFFAESPLAFNKLIKGYGYKMSLGLFEKILKKENE